MSAHLDGDRLELTELSADDAAHVTTCSECQSARRAAAARRTLLGGLTPYTLSDMAFRRVEARLMEQVEQVAEASPWRRWWWAAPVAVVLIALAWVAVDSQQTPSPLPVAVGPAAPRLLQARVEPLTVLRASGGSRVLRGHDWVPVRAGDVFASGEAFTGEVRLAPSGDFDWLFEVEGSAAVGGAGTLTLGVGEVRARVASTEATIAAGDLQVVASDAVFLVSSTAAEVLVEVSEGSVSLSETTLGRRTIKAPARVRWAHGSPAVDLPVVGVSLGESPQKPWVHFDAMSLPANVRVTLDGVELGVTPLEVLTSKGRHHVGLAPPGEALRESWVDLTGDYRAVPDALSEHAHDAPPPDEAALARVQAELRRHTPRLAACYEKWLKENPSASGEVLVHLVVNERGQVARARVEGDAAKVSAECLVRTVKSLQLPALGSEVELELPLKLTQSH